jgi:exopolysaccharide production protein ExoZ
MGRGKTVLSVQYLRGVAAVAVVLHHALVQLEKFGFQTPTDALSNGVPVFFVISGFVMWLTTAERPIGTLEFYRHRFVRIVPLYWAVSLFMLALLLVAPWAFKSSRFDLWHVISSFLFVPAMHPVKHEMQPLLFPGWTLNYEMFFYAVFGALLLFPSRLFRLGALVGIFGLLVCLSPWATGDVAAFYTRSIVLEFAAGACLGYLFVQGARLPLSASWLLMASGTVLILSTDFTGDLAPSAVSKGIPALMIVAGAVFYERAKAVPALAWAKKLGDASYSIYLVHPIPQAAITSLFIRLVHSRGAATMSALVVVETVVSVLVGLAVYAAVEKPLLAKFKRLPGVGSGFWRKGRPSQTPSLQDT